MSQQVNARFRLDETARVRCYIAGPQNKWEPTEGLRVKLSPVQGEPFGSTTPGGQLDMVIANSAAARVFGDAPIGQEFDVVLTPVADAKES
jgi:hypothetical protein